MPPHLSLASSSLAAFSEEHRRTPESLCLVVGDEPFAVLTESGPLRCRFPDARRVIEGEDGDPVATMLEAALTNPEVTRKRWSLTFGSTTDMDRSVA